LYNRIYGTLYLRQKSFVTDHGEVDFDGLDYQELKEKNPFVKMIAPPRILTLLKVKGVSRADRTKPQYFIQAHTEVTGTRYGLKNKHIAIFERCLGQESQDFTDWRLYCSSTREELEEAIALMKQK